MINKRNAFIQSMAGGEPEVTKKPTPTNRKYSVKDMEALGYKRMPGFIHEDAYVGDWVSPKGSVEFMKEGFAPAEELSETVKPPVSEVTPITPAIQKKTVIVTRPSTQVDYKGARDPISRQNLAEKAKYAVIDAKNYIRNKFIGTLKKK